WLARYNSDLRLPPDYPLTEAQITEYVIWNLGRNLGVLNDGRSSVFNLSFTAEDPEIASAIVNTLMERYIADKNDARSRTNVEANSVLSQRIETVKGEVEDLDRKVQEFRKRYQLFETRLGTIASQQLADINPQLSAARADRAQVESRYQSALAATRGAGATD